MKYDKSFLRKRSILIRKQNYLAVKNISFVSIFKLIRSYFKRKKIIIAGYFPSNYELNILNFLEESYKKNFKIALPVIQSSTKMCFKLWPYKQPLQINKFGILEPKKNNKKIVPDLVLVPLIAYDKDLNRIGYGKGYYDRMLKRIRKIKKNSIFLGIGFSFQCCKRIPATKHDFKLDYIFTEQGIISSNK